MSNRILVVTQQGEARFLTSESTPTRVITIQPTGARGETGATGAGVPTGGFENDILKKTSATNYATAWETPTSAATSGAIVRRGDTGEAFFGDYVQSLEFRADGFRPIEAFQGAELQDDTGGAVLKWGTAAQNIIISVDTTSTGHFFSNPGTATAGHFLTKNGTTPTIAAGRSAWFSSSTGDPQFRNGTSSAVTLVRSTDLGTNVATFLATPSSANLLAALTTSTGTGNNVFATSPTITTPTISRGSTGLVATFQDNNGASATVTTDANGRNFFVVNGKSGAVGNGGAYVQLNGYEEAWTTLNVLSNTSGQRVMRFGTLSNRFSIQRLNDAISSITATPFSFANNAPDYSFYMLTSGTVGFGTSTPSEKALLDLTSTTKGFLPPRMTTTQRDAITSVPAGLMVYNTTTNKLNFYNGSAWEAVTSA